MIDNFKVTVNKSFQTTTIIFDTLTDETAQKLFHLFDSILVKSKQKEEKSKKVILSDELEFNYKNPYWQELAEKLRENICCHYSVGGNPSWSYGSYCVSCSHLPDPISFSLGYNSPLYESVFDAFLQNAEFREYLERKNK